MNDLPDPIKSLSGSSIRPMLVELASRLAPRHGYNATALANVRLLRSEAVLQDVPVLYRPGAVFVLQGAKRGILEREVYRYDEDHYLAVSVPVPFRMRSVASKDHPLIAVYVDFDMALAGEIAAQVAEIKGVDSGRPKGLMSSRMDAGIEDVLLRLLTALGDPVEIAVLGQSLLRELHYRVLVGPQGGAMVAALRQTGAAGRIVQSLVRLRETYMGEVSVGDLAREAGMSIPSYHAHFRDLTGSSPMQYVKAMRLHEARLKIAGNGTIAQAAASVGYASAAQFSRDFKRHFGRTASDEAKWVHRHLGEAE
ncbi:AraC family transcriptional regulator [Neorhizobium sp. NCHU2750]|uniref:AraC family transcriptional regulator n=1 Tax=Neorhizobium sp. NCHU2750 TaxID=1825976 RepID=UPI001FE15F76